MRMMEDVKLGKVGTAITKDLSRFGRDYLMTVQYIEMILPDYDVRYIAINDRVDTLCSENEMMVFKNVFNDWFARDCSKKIKAVFKSKGQSGKPLTTNIPYGCKKSETDKNVWEVDEETAPGELNKLLETVHANEGAFVNATMEYNLTTQSQEVKKARKNLAQSEKRIVELDKLFTRLYRTMFRERFPMNALLKCQQTMTASKGS